MSTDTMSPVVTESGAVFTVEDAAGELVGVNLYQEVQRPRIGPAFTRTPDLTSWQLTWPRAAIDRMEYMLELVAEGGPPRLTPDPSNRLRAPGAFGDKSVVEWPEYRPPSWL